MNRLLDTLVIPLSLSVTLAAFVTSPVLASGQSDALLPVRQFVESMNRGDLEAAFAVCDEEMSIIDNVAPFGWHGKEACQQWSGALQADSSQQGITDLVFSLGDALQLQISDDNAYAVLPASYTFIQRGQREFVQGTFTVALRKNTSGWQMTAFTFSQR